ncbi:MAG: sugar phosphate isomerase/epimerase [Armatimonadota bacterium]|nr:sugar phosphate isomerase/epimerase [Armatimonadota bacterium]
MTEQRIVVGAHPWVYAAKQPGYDPTPILPQIFADMKYAGMDGIELMHTCFRHEGAVAQIGELSRQHGLPIIGSSFGGNFWERSAHAEVFDAAAQVVAGLEALGGKTLGVSVGPTREPKTPEQLDAQAELLTRLIALCQAHGVTLNLHNHTYEVTNNLHDLRGTLARVPQAKLGPDLNWLLRGGVDPVWFIRTYGDRIVFLHLRDQHADGRWSEAMGEGDMDYAAIAAALREVGFAGPAVIELAHERDFQPTRPLRESLRLSREYVRRVMGF